jgi:two-component system C4-dicarboxylate transport response regulator DctD
MSSRSPSTSSVATPSDWPELDRVEHAVAWVDAEGRVLRDNGAFHRRRAGHVDLGWIAGAGSRQAVAEGLVWVARGIEARRAIEMATPDERWEMVTLHRIEARPGTALLEVQDVTRRRLEERRLAAQSMPVRALLGERGGPRPGAGRPPQLHPRWLDPGLASDAALLLLGEPGAGRGHVARLLHALGARRAQPFVAIRCGDETGGGAEWTARDLLGDAADRRAAMLEAVAGGTVYLDGVDLLPPAMQARLLRLVRDEPPSIRWIASVTRGPGSPDATLRSDLLEALRQAEVRVPPLRERLDELPTIVRSLLAAHGAPSITSDALAALARHAWPGNVRELALVLDGAVRAASSASRGAGDVVLDAAHVEAALGTSRRRDATSLAELERAHVEAVLAATGHCVARAAGALGISRSTLYAVMRRHELARPARGARRAR